MNGDRLKQAMAERGLSQRQLAEKAGVSEGTISKYIHGYNKSSEIIVTLCKALNISADWLLGIEQNERR